MIYIVLKMYSIEYLLLYCKKKCQKSKYDYLIK